MATKLWFKKFCVLLVGFSVSGCAMGVPFIPII